MVCYPLPYPLGAQVPVQRRPTMQVAVFGFRREHWKYSSFRVATFGVSSSSSVSNAVSTSGATTSLFGFGWQAAKALIFNSTFNYTSFPSGFSFGASSTSIAGSTSAPMVFGSSNSASSSSIFPFTLVAAATPSPPAFGSSTSGFAFGSAPTSNNDQMEDSMAEDTIQATTPTLSVFGQQPVTPSSSGFIFGATLPSVSNPFQFGGQQNISAPQNPSQFQTTFQPSSSLQFNAGGSFSLGSGGDKSTRKFVRVKGKPRKNNCGAGKEIKKALKLCRAILSMGPLALMFNRFCTGLANIKHLHCSSNIKHLTKPPRSLNISMFAVEPKYDYLYCGSPLYGNLSPQRVREWIAYHVRLFEKRSCFIIYDARRVHEEVLKVLKPWMELGYVTLQDVRDQERFDGYYHNQFMVVNDCLHRYKFMAKDFTDVVNPRPGFIANLRAAFLANPGSWVRLEVKEKKGKK
ncbi:hypothetical protein SLEP1_g22695 [Rubroshorea leprosula]|uniref:Glycosyltransferase family 92 protein n=1 Tax=Rubroshorea leprosula TaxID=152421 RepID=A0AAV5J9Z7_9ROSI|nr:hypothetical protein SLEP1_g22695 [Rubroshorea leprosula]